MLNQPADAPTIQLRSRINEMYAEAQANRDHRNPERRRQYATLLYWIPQARNVLLHEGKRARKYDAYALQAKNGVSAADFRTYHGRTGRAKWTRWAKAKAFWACATPACRTNAPEARLSPRLDAVRAAAGEAVKAAADSSAESLLAA